MLFKEMTDDQEETVLQRWNVGSKREKPFDDDETKEKPRGGTKDTYYKVQRRHTNQICRSQVAPEKRKTSQQGRRHTNREFDDCGFQSAIHQLFFAFAIC